LEENRLIVATGLKAMQENPHPALQSLAELSGINLKEVTSEDIGFRLAPRLNAAGRLDDPHLAFDLLRGKVNNATALQKLNQTRQEITHQAVQEAEELLAQKPSNSPLIFLHKPDWHPGILGLIAGRLAEKSGLPTFISSQKPNNEVVGSARTPYAFDAAAALRSAAPLLTHFGGHHEAAGFSLLPENLNELDDSHLSYAQKLNHQTPTPTLDLDLPLEQSQLKTDLWNSLEQLEPCGIGNEKPIFLLPQIKIKTASAVGKEKKHLRLVLDILHQNFSAIGWGLGHLCSQLQTQKYYDLAIRLRKNFFNQKTSYEFELIDLV
jgi:single-stranded-DNA-specific exonuclease